MSKYVFGVIIGVLLIFFGKYFYAKGMDAFGTLCIMMAGIMVIGDHDWFW